MGFYQLEPKLFHKFQPPIFGWLFSLSFLLNCPNAVSLQANYAYRILQAKWIDSSQQTHKVTVRVKGMDNKGLVNDVTRTLNDLNVNLCGININGDEGYFDGKLIIEINNKEQLKSIIIALKNIEGIIKVSREHQ